MKERKIPLRRCTGCFEMKPKKSLIRVVRSDDGSYSIDFTGKKSGRGAYVCPDVQCLAKAQKSKGLERSFKDAIPSQVYENLRNELESNAGQTN